MSAARDSLRAAIGAEAAQPIGDAASALVDAIRRRHGAPAAAVLFYGSCLRRGDPTAAEDPVYDFYLLVDDYRRAYEGALAALSNASADCARSSLRACARAAKFSHWERATTLPVTSAGRQEGCSPQLLA